MLAVVATATVLAGCGARSGTGATAAAVGSGDGRTVRVVLTSKGCAPSPATVSAGHVAFAISNNGAAAVSEAELRSKDGAHILGEQENLTPGLSGGFSLTLQPGSYQITCSGAKQASAPFTVTGAPTSGPGDAPALTAAVTAYESYVRDQAVALVGHTRQFCTTIGTGDLTGAQLAYEPTRLFYERIEPVAETWGDLDTQIDGRWENPVTDKAKFIGFHRIEQALFQDRSLTGVPALCSALVRHEQQLQALVMSWQASPLEMAAGATDLINEAATSKISGEEERYSHVDLPTFQANVEAAAQVVSLLTPYLSSKDPTALALIGQRHDGVESALAPLKATPGYLHTGFVEYAKVTTAQRKSLSSAVNAYAEALSAMSSDVS